MINEIIAGITRRLDEVFNQDGEKYRIYAENTEQGLSEPCFFVQTRGISEKQLLNPRTMRRVMIDIVYIPEIEDNRRELHDVSEKLYDNFRFIERQNGGLMFSLNRSSEIVDGNLHFFLEFIYTAIILEAQPTMQKMDDNIRIKKGGIS